MGRGGVSDLGGDEELGQAEDEGEAGEDAGDAQEVGQGGGEEEDAKGALKAQAVEDLPEEDGAVIVQGQPAREGLGQEVAFQVGC
jgi:hypothetical protein